MLATTSHTRTELSLEPETTRVLSLENAAEQTKSEWPFNLLSSAPVDESHIRTEKSHEPDTMRVPSVENATEETGSV